MKRYLAKQGCRFETHRGSSGHLTIYLGDKKSQLPMHGGAKELGPKLVAKNKNDLGLK
jgi:mRNA interferase HicA